MASSASEKLASASPPLGGGGSEEVAVGFSQGDDLLDTRFQHFLPTFGGEPVELGIDEAGRGPVLGPMVYGCCYGPISKHKELKAMKFNDSKQLQESERDSGFEKIKAAKDQFGWVIAPLTAPEISGKMLRRRKCNLNQMSHDTAQAMIRMVMESGANVQEVYVDTVGDPERYTKQLKMAFPAIPTIRAEKKADATYEIVSAASILAKVTRDKEVRECSFEETGRVGEVLLEKVGEMGCGYPGDEKTKAWLSDSFDKVFGFPKTVRFSWQTAETMMKDKSGVEVAYHDEAEEDGGMKILQFFRPLGEEHPRKKFFNDRKIAVATAF